MPLPVRIDGGGLGDHPDPRRQGSALRVEGTQKAEVVAAEPFEDVLKCVGYIVLGTARPTHNAPERAVHDG